jgi:hypothetical protein
MVDTYSEKEDRNALPYSFDGASITIDKEVLRHIRPRQAVPDVELQQDKYQS